MNAAFWKGKRVFVTGQTGFKGSWLSLWLQDLGSTVSGYSLAPHTDPSLYGLARVGEGMNSHRGDIRDLEKLAKTIAAEQPEVIFHLAAQSLVRPSFQDPVTTFATNVMGTVNVLEAARGIRSVRVIVVVTSDKCYENREWVWGYRETDQMGGHDPYSSSKGCAELVTAAYRRSFFGQDDRVRVATVRAGNVLGGGDWSTDRLIPDVVRAFSSGETLTVRNPRSIRPWQHVLDPLCGYLTLAERLWGDAEAVGGWNFGPDESGARPVSDIVGRMHESWGTEAAWKLSSGAQPHEAAYLKLDCSKAMALLGWVGRLDLDEAIDWTVEWYKGLTSGDNIRSLTQAQIHRYQVRLSQ